MSKLVLELYQLELHTRLLIRSHNHDFYPPHEVPPLQSKFSSTSTKKSLPWIRKPAPSLEGAQSPTTKTRDIATASTMNSKSRNLLDVLLSTPVAKDSVVEKNVGGPNDKGMWPSHDRRMLLTF